MYTNSGEYFLFPASTEEQAVKGASPDETMVDDDIHDGTVNITQKAPEDGSSSDEEDDGDGGEDGENTETLSAKHSVLKGRSTQSLSKGTPSTQQTRKSLGAVVTKMAKRLGLDRKSDAARKCPALFGEGVDGKDFTSDRAEIVGTWTGTCSLQSRSFFLWPSRETLAATLHAKVALAQPSYSALLVDLCERCVGHTAFLPIMQGGEHRAVRGALVSLLACLVRLEKTCCSALPLNALVAAYGATLSLTGKSGFVLSLKVFESL